MTKLLTAVVVAVVVVVVIALVMIVFPEQTSDVVSTILGG